MIRLIDVLIAVLGLLVFLPFMVVLLMVGWFDSRAPLFFQERVGRHCRLFTLVKFRTMRVGTAQVATHEASANSVTPYGRFLRRTKLDELPQLWNVLTGSMSIVGPRPCLPTQTELIDERDRLGVNEVRPGITGLGQVKGIDMSTPQKLAEIDAQMIANYGIVNYFSCIAMTIIGRGSGDRVRE